MSSKNQTLANQPLNCKTCNEPVRKTASREFVCIECGRISKARPVK